MIDMKFKLKGKVFQKSVLQCKTDFFLFEVNLSGRRRGEQIRFCRRAG